MEIVSKLDIIFPFDLANLIMEFTTDNETWTSISQKQGLSEKFIRRFQHHVNWFIIPSYQDLSEDFVREFRKVIEWDVMACTALTFSDNFKWEFKDYLHWGDIFEELWPVSEKFLKEFYDRVILPRGHIGGYDYSVDWGSLLDNINDRFVHSDKISGIVYREYDYMIDGNAYRNDISEDFIREFKSKINIYEN